MKCCRAPTSRSARRRISAVPHRPVLVELPRTLEIAISGLLLPEPESGPRRAAGRRGWGQPCAPRNRPAAGRYGPQAGPPSPGGRAPALAPYAAFLAVALMIAEALLAASCKVFDDRCA